MFIQRLEEYKIPIAVHSQISLLLTEAFSGYPKGQTYYKQLPDFRYLIWEEERLIGHMGVEHRLMNNDGQTIKVFGVADLCIAQSHQHKKLATGLLTELERLGRKYGIDFIILMAKEHQLYLSNGFDLVKNECRWLLIQNNNCLGIIHRRIDQALMVKPLANIPWKNGVVDFLGPVF